MAAKEEEAEKQAEKVHQDPEAKKYFSEIDNMVSVRVTVLSFCSTPWT